jgi:hypothetical protein
MNSFRLFACTLAFVFAAPLAAQDTQPGAAKPPQMSAEEQRIMDAWMAAGKTGAEHEQLKALVGTWNAATTMWMSADAPPQQGKGTETGESIHGGRFVRSSFDGEWNGEKFEGTALTGYDNARKKFVETWHDSMSTGIFVAYGDYDAATKTYTFHGEVADPAFPGTLTKVRQLVKVESPDRHTMTWYETRGTAPEMKTMEIVYTRAK